MTNVATLCSRIQFKNEAMIEEPHIQECEVAQGRELSFDVLYGAQLCVHQFRTTGGRKT